MDDTSSEEQAVSSEKPVADSKPEITSESKKKKSSGPSHSREPESTELTSSVSEWFQEKLSRFSNHSMSKKLHGDNPHIFYMNGDALSRPLDAPRKVMSYAAGIALIAAVIGGIFLYTYFDDLLNAPVRDQEAVEELLSTEQPLNLPDMISLLPMDDATILATLQASGDTIFEKTPIGSGNSFELIKLPAGVSVVDAASMYLTGIDHLSATQAVTLLNGAWDLDVDRESGLNMGLHYADFAASSVDGAVQQALTAEGFDAATATDSGVDASGNTYSAGTLELDGVSYAWRISALPLSEVYKIPGVPESAVYVGIRIAS